MRPITFPDDTEDNPQSEAERAQAAARSTWVSVAVNILLSVSQIVAGVLSKSQGLIADGIHSLPLTLASRQSGEVFM